MEKQDILNQIEWHLEETEGENASGTFDQGYKEGCYHCEALIEQLDEPQKVKVPQFVAEWFEENKHNLNFAIYELCEAGKVPVDLYEGLSAFERWFYLNHDIETLIRMQDGYEVEEEPKWVVKVDDNAYFVDFFDSLTPHLVDGLGWEVMRLDDKSKADAVALIIGGTAEKA